jgi:hypothetical protein
MRTKQLQQIELIQSCFRRKPQDFGSALLFEQVVGLVDQGDLARVILGLVPLKRLSVV